MKKILILIIIIGAIAFAFSKMGPKENIEISTSPIAETASIEGCYVARLSKDVYILNIQSENEGQIAGTLAYNNFEKDSSRGIINGTFSNNLLIAEYAFSSEGMDSIRQVAFKKTGDNFVQGFGPVTVEGSRESFVDLTQVTFTNSPIFEKSDCGNLE